jgi:hypothetical protein
MEEDTRTEMEVDTEKEIEVETDQFLADRHFQSVAANL